MQEDNQHHFAKGSQKMGLAGGCHFLWLVRLVWPWPVGGSPCPLAPEGVNGSWVCVRQHVWPMTHRACNQMPCWHRDGLQCSSAMKFIVRTGPRSVPSHRFPPGTGVALSNISPRVQQPCCKETGANWPGTSQ